MKNFMIMVLEKAVGFAMKVIELMRLKRLKDATGTLVEGMFKGMEIVDEVVGRMLYAVLAPLNLKKEDIMFIKKILMTVFVILIVYRHLFLDIILFSILAIAYLRRRRYEFFMQRRQENEISDS